MLFSHATDTHVSANNNHAVVGHQADQTEHSCLEVLLMSTEIDEGYQLFRLGSDLAPLLVLGACTLQLYLLLIIAKPHDLLSDT